MYELQVEDQLSASCAGLYSSLGIQLEPHAPPSGGVFRSRQAKPVSIAANGYISIRLQ